jgi:fermentation-respiration switch protein FrsA (DUF1100 family)
VHGTDDAQIPADHATRLAAARRASSVSEPVVIDGVDHQLLTSGTVDVDPRVIDALGRFILAAATGSLARRSRPSLS